MTAAENTASITDRVRPVAAGGPVSAVHFLKEHAVFVMGEEELLFVDSVGSEARVAVHLADRITLDWAAPVLFVRGEESPRIQVPIAKPVPPPQSHYVVHGVLVIGDHTNVWNSK